MLMVLGAMIGLIMAEGLGLTTAGGLAFGAILGAGGMLLAPVSRTRSPARSLSAAVYAPLFAAWFLWEVVKSNLVVARIVLSPLAPLRPAFLKIQIEGLTDGQIALLANIISLTPGTLSLDVAPSRRALYVHFADVPDARAAERRIRTEFVPRVRRLLP
jgi:multicomponent Na+:H+ antiporter subunit E